MKHQKYKVANHKDGCRSDWPILQRFCISHCNGLLLDKLISFVIFRFIHYLLYVFCYRRLVQDSWNSFWPSFITKFFKIASVQFSSEIFIRRGCTRSKHVVNPEYSIPQWYCLQTIPQFTKRQAGQKKKKKLQASDNISGVTVFLQLFCVMYVGVTAKCFLFSSLVSLCLWSLIRQGTFLYKTFQSVIFHEWLPCICDNLCAAIFILLCTF